jgi:hypothetical protein
MESTLHKFPNVPLRYVPWVYGFLTLLFEFHVSTATQSPYLKCLLGRVHAGLVNLLTKAGRFLSFFKKCFHTDWLSIHGTARLTFGARSPPRYGDTWVLLPFYK